MTRFYGKRDAEAPRAGVANLGELLKTVDATLLPKRPHWFGHAYDFGSSNWLMLGNGPDNSVFPGFQGCGDCAWAWPAHQIMEDAYNARRPIPRFSGKTVVEQYSAYSGFDPGTGQNDNGSNLQDVMQWRQTRGFYDDENKVYKIGQYVALTPGDLEQLWYGAWLFESVTIGVQIQQAQEQAFPGTWTYVPGSPIVGGHCVGVAGITGLISWGCRVGYTQSFIENLCDEAYVSIDPLMYNAVTGETCEHFADQDLEKYIKLVAQAKSGSGVSN